MEHRRRFRLGRYICCDKLSSEVYYPPPWPRAPSPRRIMENGKGNQINIFPTNRKFEVDQCLSVRVDKKIDRHLVSKDFVNSKGNPVMEPAEGKITDSSGRVYDCIGAIKATWRIEGYNFSELDYFIVAHGDFPENVDVLLADLDNVRSSLSLCDKPKSQVVLPIFSSWKTRKQDKADREKIENRQAREAKAEMDRLLKKHDKPRQSQASKSAPSNRPPEPSQGQN